MDTLSLDDGRRLGRKSRATSPYDSSYNPSRASMPTRHPAIHTEPTKQTSTAETTYDHTSRLTLTPHNNNGYFLTTTAKPPKRRRTRIYPQPSSHMDLHQSTCLNLTASNDESDLWILPDFDDWEADAESPQQEVPPPRAGEWATTLLTRAVNSNRERLRRRLEGDGWDFVGGKYGDDGKLLKDVDTGSEESVDEEFDVVVLPMVEVPC